MPTVLPSSDARSSTGLSSVDTRRYSISWFGMPIATNGAPSWDTAFTTAIGALRITSTLPAASCCSANGALWANCRFMSRPLSLKNPPAAAAVSAMKLIPTANGIIAEIFCNSTGFVVVAPASRARAAGRRVVVPTARGQVSARTDRDHRAERVLQEVAPVRGHVLVSVSDRPRRVTDTFE